MIKHLHAKVCYQKDIAAQLHISILAMDVHMVNIQTVQTLIPPPPFTLSIAVQKHSLACGVT
jgi:hypothetical protein